MLGVSRCIIASRTKIVSSGPVCLAEKPWLEVLFTDLLWEKNTTEWLTDSADKLKRTGLKHECSKYTVMMLRVCGNWTENYVWVWLCHSNIWTMRECDCAIQTFVICENYINY
jgi:hypothetical protein